MAGGLLELRREGAVEVAGTPRSAKLKLATSLEGAKKDELMLLDGRGGVMDRWGIRRAFARAYAVALGQGIAWGAGLVTAAWLHPVAGIVGLGGYVWFITARLRWQIPMKRTLALVAARRYDEAHDRLVELDGLPLPAAQRPHVKQILAGLTWLRGDLPKALGLFDEAIAATRVRRNANAVACRWICTLSRAHLLVVMGRRDEVLRAADDLDQAPGGDFFAFMRQQVTLALAFDAGDAAALPDTLVLHEWARAALLRNRFGTALVYLAWAFAQRGELDMARLCLAESNERSEHEIDKSNPQLHAWAEERRQEWRGPEG